MSRQSDLRPPLPIPPRTASITRLVRSSNHKDAGSSHAARLQTLHRRLPWLDGNAPSRTMPGDFDASSASIRRTATGQVARQQTSSSARLHSVPKCGSTTALKSDQAISSGSSMQTHPSMPSIEPTSLQMKHLSEYTPPDMEATKSSGTYTPSTYTLATPSEGDTLHQLARSGSVSYERLIGEPYALSSATEAPAVPDDARPATLSTVEAPGIPKRQSSLASSSLCPVLVMDEVVPSTVGTVQHIAQRYHSRRPSSSSSTWSATIQLTPRSSADGVQPPSRESSGRTSPASKDDLFEQTRSMHGAVTSLQGLMEEAINMIQSVHHTNDGDNGTAVLNEAADSLRRNASMTIKPEHPDHVSETSPDTSEESMDDDDDDDDVDSEHSIVLSGSLQSDHTSPTSLECSDHETDKSLVCSNCIRCPLPDSSSFDARRPGDYYPDSEVVAAVQSRQTNNLSPASECADQPSSLKAPRLYNPPSADSIVIDFAYVERKPSSQHAVAVFSVSPQAAPEGQPGPQKSLSFAQTQRPSTVYSRSKRTSSAAGPIERAVSSPRHSTSVPVHPRLPPPPVPRIFEAKIATSAPLISSAPDEHHRHHRHRIDPRRALESRYYRINEHNKDGNDTSDSKHEPGNLPVEGWSLRHPRRHHVSLGERQSSIRVHKYKRKGIAREWNTFRKRIAAVIACLNTTLVGLVAGIYAGEVPKIQYQLADQNHRVILGNVLLYICLGITTLLAWPLPLLHGRKPYVLVALALTLPLQFPQALSVGQTRDPSTRYYVGLLLPRAFSGLCLGFANVNFIATLFDLFGASLQSHRPHQEVVDFDDVRRQGGGMGLWLGVWAFCFVGSLAVGFLLGATVTAKLDPAWGFYFMIIILAVFLALNVLAPETRRAPHRRSILHYFDEEHNMKRRVARGEVKLHLSQDGPRYWWEEIWAGVQLMGHMLLQPGFVVLAFYTAWIYAMVVLTTLLLGALLSTEYVWKPEYVGLAVFALAIGALFAIPLSKANIFSRHRVEPSRTDSMTFHPRVTWSSHLIRRCLFTFALPLVGLAFTLSSPGPRISWAAPVVTSGLVGFLSTLAIAECVGLIMETFDTCDLQPGVNSKHRLQSLESTTRRRRTNYSSFPRVAAGIFVAQSLGFFLAAAATGVSGRITRAIGAQKATGVTIGVLLFFTILLTLVLWRFRAVQVIPNYALGTKKGSREWTAEHDDKYWKPVIVGNPSGKVRRMNLLESGRWSRWTEIRRLNKLSKGSLKS